MENVEFDEPMIQNRHAKKSNQIETDQKGMMGFLIRHGLAKDENAANTILIGVAIFFFAMSIITYYVITR